MTNILKKFFQLIATCILALTLNNFSVSAITKSDFIPCLNQLRYIHSQYTDKKTLNLLGTMITRIRKIISGEFRHSQKISLERQLYKNLVLPILVSAFYDSFKDVNYFPEEVLRSNDDCKICLGKGKDGKYWCFVLENKGLSIKAY